MNQRTTKAGSSSCQCSTTLYGTQKERMNHLSTHSKTIKAYAERFLRGHWSFLGLGSEKKWYGTYDGKPDGSWKRTAEKMLQNFEGSGHPIFRSTSSLERGQLRSKAGGKTTIHFNGSAENIELLLQMVISVNQLSQYGAVADMIATIWPSLGHKSLQSTRKIQC